MNRRAFLCQLLCAAGAVAATAASAPLAHALTPADLKLPPDSALPAPEPAISHGDEATAEEAQWGRRRRRRVWRRRYVFRRRRFYRRRFYRRRYYRRWRYW
jgi:hypothetical protein